MESRLAEVFEVILSTGDTFGPVDYVQRSFVVEARSMYIEDRGDCTAGSAAHHYSALSGLCKHRKLDACAVLVRS